MRTGSDVTRLGVLIAVACVLLTTAGLSAAELPTDAVKVSGKVGKKTIETPGGEAFHIVLDEKGRDLIKTMVRESVSIFGTVTEKNGRKWLKVLEYTEVEMTAAHELWRRMRCNACVVAPAIVIAAVPKDLSGARPLAGRYYSLKEKTLAWCVNAETLWVATDNKIVRIDMKTKQVVRTFDRKDGLPDQRVEELVCDGKMLWIAYRGGVAALTVSNGQIVDLPALKANYARIVTDAAGVWVIASTGTFHLAGPDQQVESYPALPTGRQIALAVEKGIWLPHWRRRTAHFITAPMSVGGKLYVGSFGDVYELDDGKWSKIAAGGWCLQESNGHVWFLTSKGLTEYDPAAKKRTDHVPPEIDKGRYTALSFDGQAAWVAAEPSLRREGVPPMGGGLGRFDLATHTWQTWREIDGHSARVACLSAEKGNAWVVTMDGQYSVKSAHPGMTYVKRSVFDVRSFQLCLFDSETATWQSHPLEMSELEKRLICGQDGSRGSDAIVPQAVEQISVGPKQIFAATKLLPKSFFSGYWPCINAIASRKDIDEDWTIGFLHSPEQINLQGEQPLVLNISNKGELVLPAVGHDETLALFLHDGVHWAVTEGGVACFDETSDKWSRVVELGFRFYWRATAAYEDDGGLYVGSDRGLVSRLDFQTGRFDTLVALRNRSISRIFKDEQGRIVVVSRPDTLGMLPVQLREKLPFLDCSVARFDGKKWEAVQDGVTAPPRVEAEWFFRRLKKRHPHDKSKGNFLWTLAEGAAKPALKYYVKEVFYPQFLCQDAKGERMWISTFTGLLRLDLQEESTPQP
jgi:ligand-binding sensor domain-containing protein